MNTNKGTDHINHQDGICKRNDRDMYRICPSKLSKRELEDLYFSLLENNLELKRNVNMYQDKVKTLSAKLQRMSAYKNGARNDANVSKSIVDEQRDCISQLKKANACMAERIRVLNMRLCSAKQFLKRPSSALYSKATNRESFKNSSMCALNAKASDANTRVSNSTSCHFQDVNDSPEETKTVETETEVVLGRHDTGKPCDGVKCKTTVEELREKIVNLQKVEEKVKSVSYEAKAYKDDSGYTEPQDLNRSVVEDQMNNRVYQELVNQIADLQSQLDTLRIYVAGEAKIITTETKSNKATDFVPYGGEMKDFDISSQFKNDKPTEFKPFYGKTTADYISHDLMNEQPAQCAYYDVDTMDADDILSHLIKSPTKFKPYEVESKKSDSTAYEFKSYNAETMEPNDARQIYFKPTETQSQQKDNDVHCQIPSHVHQNPDRTDQKKNISKNIRREPSTGKQTTSIEEHDSCGNSSVNIIIDAKTAKRCSLHGSQTKKSMDEKAGKIRKSYSEERVEDSPKIKERFVKNLGRQSLDGKSIKISDDIVERLMTKIVDKISVKSKDVMSPEIKNDLAKARNCEGPGKSIDFESNGENTTDDKHKPQTISPRAKIIVKEYAQDLLSMARKKNVRVEKKQSNPTAIQSTNNKERKNTGAYAPPYRESVNAEVFNGPEMAPTVSAEREKAQSEVSAVATQMEGIDESLADAQADIPAASNRRDSATYTADVPKTYSISDRHSRTASADDTEDEIPSLAEWAKDGKTPQHSCATQAMSPGEEKATLTSTDPYSDVYASLSEGEMPGGDLSVGERPRAGVTSRPTLENHHAPPERMQATLQSISEELARCRLLLHSQRAPEVILWPSVK